MRKCLFPPSLSFWLPHSNWVDPLFGLQQLWKFCLLTCQQLGYPWSILGSQWLIDLAFFDHVDNPVNGWCTQSNQHLGSKDSRIWYDMSHSIFVIAPNSFYLNPYDDVTQGLEEYSSKAIYTQGDIGQVNQGTNIQRTNLNELWGHHIDGWATSQKNPTVPTINPDLGYILRPTSLSKWIGVQEGNFLRHPQAEGASCGDAGWVTTGFWGAQPPFFFVPFSFKLTFWAVLLRAFGQSFMRWSGLPHPKQFWFFLWYSSTALAKWTIYLTNWSASPTPFRVSVPSSAEDSASSSPSGFAPEPSSASLLSTVPDWVVKVWMPFNFWEGNKFLGSENELHPILQLQWFFRSRGSLASAHLSNFWAASSRLE